MKTRIVHSCGYERRLLPRWLTRLMNRLGLIGHVQNWEIPHPQGDWTEQQVEERKKELAKGKCYNCGMADSLEKEAMDRKSG